MSMRRSSLSHAGPSRNSVARRQSVSFANAEIAVFTVGSASNLATNIGSHRLPQHDEGDERTEDFAVGAGAAGAGAPSARLSMGAPSVGMSESLLFSPLRMDDKPDEVEVNVSLPALPDFITGVAPLRLHGLDVSPAPQAAARAPVVAVAAPAAAAADSAMSDSPSQFVFAANDAAAPTQVSFAESGSESSGSGSESPTTDVDVVDVAGDAYVEGDATMDITVDVPLRFGKIPLDKANKAIDGHMISSHGTASGPSAGDVDSSTMDLDLASLACPAVPAPSAVAFAPADVGGIFSPFKAGSVAASPAQSRVASAVKSARPSIAAAPGSAQRPAATSSSTPAKSVLDILSPFKSVPLSKPGTAATADKPALLGSARKAPLQQLSANQLNVSKAQASPMGKGGKTPSKTPFKGSSSDDVVNYQSIVAAGTPAGMVMAGVDAAPIALYAVMAAPAALPPTALLFSPNGRETGANKRKSMSSSSSSSSSSSPVTIATSSAVGAGSESIDGAAAAVAAGGAARAAPSPARDVMSSPTLRKSSRISAVVTPSSVARSATKRRTPARATAAAVAAAAAGAAAGAASDMEDAENAAPVNSLHAELAAAATGASVAPGSEKKAPKRRRTVYAVSEATRGGLRAATDEASIADLLRDDVDVDAATAVVMTGYVAPVAVAAEASSSMMIDGDGDVDVDAVTEMKSPMRIHSGDSDESAMEFTSCVPAASAAVFAAAAASPAAAGAADSMAAAMGMLSPSAAGSLHVGGEDEDSIDMSERARQQEAHSSLFVADPLPPPTDADIDNDRDLSNHITEAIKFMVPGMTAAAAAGPASTPSKAAAGVAAGDDSVASTVELANLSGAHAGMLASPRPAPASAAHSGPWVLDAMDPTAELSGEVSSISEGNGTMEFTRNYANIVPSALAISPAKAAGEALDPLSGEAPASAVAASTASPAQAVADGEQEQEQAQEEEQEQAQKEGDMSEAMEMTEVVSRRFVVNSNRRRSSVTGSGYIKPAAAAVPAPSPSMSVAEEANEADDEEDDGMALTRVVTSKIVMGASSPAIHSDATASVVTSASAGAQSEAGSTMDFTGQVPASSSSSSSSAAAAASVSADVSMADGESMEMTGIVRAPAALPASAKKAVAKSPALSVASTSAASTSPAAAGAARTSFANDSASMSILAAPASASAAAAAMGDYNDLSMISPAASTSRRKRASFTNESVAASGAMAPPAPVSRVARGQAAAGGVSAASKASSRGSIGSARNAAAATAAAAAAGTAEMPSQQQALNQSSASAAGSALFSPHSSVAPTPAHMRSLMQPGSAQGSAASASPAGSNVTAGPNTSIVALMEKFKEQGIDMDEFVRRFPQGRDSIDPLSMSMMSAAGGVTAGMASAASSPATTAVTRARAPRHSVSNFQPILEEGGDRSFESTNAFTRGDGVGAAAAAAAAADGVTADLDFSRAVDRDAGGGNTSRFSMSMDDEDNAAGAARDDSHLLSSSRASVSGMMGAEATSLATSSVTHGVTDASNTASSDMPSSSFTFDSASSIGAGAAAAAAAAAAASDSESGVYGRRGGPAGMYKDPATVAGFLESMGINLNSEGGGGSRGNSRRDSEFGLAGQLKRMSMSLRGAPSRKSLGLEDEDATVDQAQQQQQQGRIDKEELLETCVQSVELEHYQANVETLIDQNDKLRSFLTSMQQQLDSTNPAPFSQLKHNISDPEVQRKMRALMAYSHQYSQHEFYVARAFWLKETMGGLERVIGKVDADIDLAAALKDKFETLASLESAANNPKIAQMRAEVEASAADIKDLTEKRAALKAQVDADVVAERELKEEADVLVKDIAEAEAADNKKAAVDDAEKALNRERDLYHLSRAFAGWCSMEQYAGESAVGQPTVGLTMRLARPGYAIGFQLRVEWQTRDGAMVRAPELGRISVDPEGDAKGRPMTVQDKHEARHLNDLIEGLYYANIASFSEMLRECKSQSTLPFVAAQLNIRLSHFYSIARDIRDLMREAYVTVQRPTSPVSGPCAPVVSISMTHAPTMRQVNVQVAIQPSYPKFACDPKIVVIAAGSVGSEAGPAVAAALHNRVLSIVHGNTGYGRLIKIQRAVRDLFEE